MPPTAPLWFASGSEGTRFGTGAVFEERGSPSVVLTGDYLAGSAERMTDGRKKGKGFRWIRLAINFGTSGAGSFC